MERHSAADNVQAAFGFRVFLQVIKLQRFEIYDGVNHSEHCVHIFSP